MNKVTLIGVDLAKNIFSINCVDKTEALYPSLSFEVVTLPASSVYGRAGNDRQKGDFPAEARYFPGCGRMYNTVPLPFSLFVQKAHVSHQTAGAGLFPAAP